MGELSIEQKINELHAAVVGNQYSKGILHRLDKLENDNKLHKLIQSIGAAVVSVIAFFGWK